MLLFLVQAALADAMHEPCAGFSQKRESRWLSAPPRYSQLNNLMVKELKLLTSQLQLSVCAQTLSL
jgi:hypothetical protein